jgi:hypothetical protein
MRRTEPQQRIRPGREGARAHPLFAAALFEPIRLGS